MRAKLTLRVGLGRPASSSGIKCVSRCISSLLRHPLRRERAAHSSVLGFEYGSTEKLASTTPIGLTLHYDHVRIVTDVLKCIRARKTAFWPWSTSKPSASVGNKAATGLAACSGIRHPFSGLSSTSPHPPICLRMRAFLVNQLAHPSKIPVLVLQCPQNVDVTEGRFV